MKNQNVFDIFNHLLMTREEEGYEITKSHSLNDPKFPLMKKNLYEENGSSDLVVPYFLWGNLQYAKLLYISLLTQYLYTDIKKHDLHIYFSRSLQKYSEVLTKIFKPFTPHIYFKEKRFKYFAPFYEETKDYKYIAHSDSDLFFCGSRKNLYERFKENLDYYRRELGEHPYICSSPYPYRSRKFRVNTPEIKHNLYENNKVKDRSFESLKEWIVYASPMDITHDELEEWIENGKPWPWNTIYGYNINLFRNSDFKEMIDWYYDHTLEWWDEEQIYWLQLNRRDIPFINLNEFFNGNDIRFKKPYYFKEDVPEYIRHDPKLSKSFEIVNTLGEIKWDGSDDNLYIVHPDEYHPGLTHSVITSNFFDFILKEARKNLL